MSQIVREDIDALNAVLTVTISAHEYASEFEVELNKYRKKAQLKGFRAGKTPLGVIKKMYGRAILSDLVNRKLDESLGKYLVEEKVDLLGQPLPVQDHPPVDMDPKNLHDLTFVFDVGLAPEFEVKGIEPDSTFETLEVKINEEEAREEFEKVCRQAGTQVDADSIVPKDIVRLFAEELTADGQVIPDGISNEFSVFTDNLHPQAEAQLLGKAVGDQLQMNIYELEKESPEDYVRKYFLELAEDDTRTFAPVFNFTVREIKRLQLPELNQEFFDEQFGDDVVHSPEEAVAHIGRMMQQRYQGPVDALLFRDFQERLLEQTHVPLPDAFLKRWLVESNESNTPEAVEAGYENFAKNLQWTLIRNKLTREFDLSVSEEEIRIAFARQFFGYFGGARPEWLSDDMLASLIDRSMQTKKDVDKKYDELLTDKLHEAIKARVKLSTRQVTEAELDDIMEEARKQARAADNDLLPDFDDFDEYDEYEEEE